MSYVRFNIYFLPQRSAPDTPICLKCLTSYILNNIQQMPFFDDICCHIQKILRPFCLFSHRLPRKKYISFHCHRPHTTRKLSFRKDINLYENDNPYSRFHRFMSYALSTMKRNWLLSLPIVHRNLYVIDKKYSRVPKKRL